MAIQTMGLWFNRLTDHFVVVCLIFALPILALTGAGNVLVVSLLGLLLCAVGVVQSSARVDLWIFIPLTAYNFVNMASAWAVYGNPYYGYAPTQLIFSVLYLLAACLKDGEMRMLKRLCALWAGAAAVLGIGQFTFFAVAQNAKRLGGVLNNPNATGIFLVVGWFVLLDCASGWDGDSRNRSSLLAWLEPLLLFALALTLSMGSFAAMAAGVLVLLIEKKCRTSWRETFQYACRILAKASLGIGSGILMYLAASRTGAPWTCLAVLAYLLAETLCWRKFEAFLEAYRPMAAAISAMGLLVAAAAVAIRPSAAATFAERLDMMRSGLRYLTVNPLLGVGPYQWRMLNMMDCDHYFNTWHIHNVLLHAGVEFGWIAMALLVLLAVRAFRKKSGTKSCLAAFGLHNMMDTSFFYLGITGLILLAAGDPRQNGKPVPAGGLRLLFGCFTLAFLYNLFFTLLSA